MVEELKLSGNELLVYGVIHSSENQTYALGQEQLSKTIGSGIATVKRSLKKLLELGIIVKVSKGYYKVSKGYYKVSKGYSKYQNDTVKYQNDTLGEYIYNNIYNNNISSNNIIQEKEIKKEKEKLSVSELVGEFESNDRLMNLYGGSDIVRERLEYKQSKKDRAYKKKKGFIQQMQVIIKDIQFGQPRGDLPKRFEFAVNKAMENERKGIYWSEKIESEYQNFKAMNKT